MKYVIFLINEDSNEENRQAGVEEKEKKEKVYWGSQLSLFYGQMSIF